ncbi:MAG TPA: DUF4215 domain-containing protein, partial [Candidatus Polarisedimenticolia bacterium]|nr:DUF4215 domain-containing protein [Candidatus Polarisedimenticolia bacterium]
MSAFLSHLCGISANNHSRLLRALAGMLVGWVALVGGQMAWAHQNPAGCTTDALYVALLKDKTSIVSGETATFTVIARNDDPTACDVTNANIVVHCPAPDGTPTGAAMVCGPPNVDFLVPFAPITLCQVACVVTFNPGVISAQALEEESGILHIIPDYDFAFAYIHRTLSVTLRVCPAENEDCTYCGDGLLQPGSGETCDQTAFQPGAPSGRTCRTDCTFCGDGIVNGGELCDDGNNIDTDACGNNCSFLECGDGIVSLTGGETCDPPGSIPTVPAGNTNVCRSLGPAQCTFCGDGIVNDGEQCDDGNNVNTDGCANNCAPFEACGDGIVGNSPGETCDPPGSIPTTPAGNRSPCRADCSYCGDGIVNDGEFCDDGNHVDTDGCPNDCTIHEPCIVIIAKTVAPDDGASGETACDGVADGPFVESVTVDQTTCVVYQICVTNAGPVEVLNGNGVKVGDPVLGAVNLDYGTIQPGATVCKQTAGVFTAPKC